MAASCKNIGSITDEINVTTDGTFTSTNGIIKTIDALRAVGYAIFSQIPGIKALAEVQE